MDFNTEIEQLISGDKQDDIYSDDHYLPAEIELEIVDLPLVVSTENDKEDDYRIARSLHHSLILKGNSALEKALKTFANTESPQVLREINTLIKTLSNSSVDMVKLQDLVKERNVKALTKEGEIIDGDVLTSNKNLNSQIDDLL